MRVCVCVYVQEKKRERERLRSSVFLTSNQHPPTILVSNFHPNRKKITSLAFFFV